MAKKLSEVLPTDEVVVVLGAKQAMQSGKTVTVEKEKQVTMTKAGFDSMDLDKDGFCHMMGRTVKLAGTPKYKAKPTDSMAGQYNEIDKVEPFTTEAPAGDPEA